jgi:hypothetical protein
MTKPDAEPFRNRHPADELAELRAEARKLVGRAKKLRAKLLEMPEEARRGDAWHAKVIIRDNIRVDMKRLKNELGLERVRQFMRKRPTSYLFLIRNRKGA